MHLREYPVNPLPPRLTRPRIRRERRWVLALHLERDRGELLQKPYGDERHLVVSELQKQAASGLHVAEMNGTDLLSKADPRSSVEREEDEVVGEEVLLQALVQETVRIELFR